ncbi:hypothetical protein KI387_029037, partial [Taxus chinensis]
IRNTIYAAKMAKMCTRSVEGGSVWVFRLCILILVVATVMAARPIERGTLKASMLFEKDEMGIKYRFYSNMDKEQLMAGKECDNDTELEECTNRRTLSAHTDYIYTQDHN